jgi:hypothetical protein
MTTSGLGVPFGFAQDMLGLLVRANPHFKATATGKFAQACKNFSA